MNKSKDDDTLFTLPVCVACGKECEGTCMNMWTHDRPKEGPSIKFTSHLSGEAEPVQMKPTECYDVSRLCDECMIKAEQMCHAEAVLFQEELDRKKELFRQYLKDFKNARRVSKM